MNNNSLIFSSKIGDIMPPNPEMNPVIDEKPELNPDSINQELNENKNTNSPKQFPMPQS
jgi:hypothetical protein